jgi:hypothetical protein
MSEAKSSRNTLDLAVLPKQVARFDNPQFSQPPFACDSETFLHQPGECPAADAEVFA